MSNNDPTQTITLRIQRFNPDIDKKPYLKNYQVVRSQGMTVLDALHKVKTEQDGAVTYRRSCRHAICGSCAMNVNGKNIPVRSKKNPKIPIASIVCKYWLWAFSRRSKG